MRDVQPFLQMNRGMHCGWAFLTSDSTSLMQAANPKDQYLLLKALNEVIVSLAASSSGLLAPAYRKEVIQSLPSIFSCLPCHTVLSLLSLQMRASVSTFAIVKA